MDIDRTVYKGFLNDAIASNTSISRNNILSKLASYFEDICQGSIIINNKGEEGVVCDSLLILESFFAKGLSFRIITFASNATFDVNYIKNIAFACLYSGKKIPHCILVIGHGFKISRFFTVDTKLYTKQIKSKNTVIIKPNFLSYVIKNKYSKWGGADTVEKIYRIEEACLFVRGNKAVLICHQKKIKDVIQSIDFKRHFDYIYKCLVIGTPTGVEACYE